MKRCVPLVLALTALLSAPAAAERLTLAQVKQQNAKRVSADELRSLIPGGKYRLSAGRLETTWTHTPDGKVSGRRIAGNRNDARNGTWQIRDDGTYCVDLVGNTPDDVAKWCRHVYRLGNLYYSFEPDAPADTARYGFELGR